MPSGARMWSVEIDVESLSARGLDHLAEPVGIDAVLPALTGIEGKRHQQRLVQAASCRRDAAVAHVLRQHRVPRAVAEACRVSHEVAERDRPLCPTQLRLAARIEAFEHLRRGEVGQHVSDWSIERELAAFDEPHGGNAGDRLGHGGEPEHAVECHRVGLAEVALAECALVDRLAAGGRHGDDANDLAGVGCGAQRLVHAGQLCHGVPRFVSLKS